MGVFRYIILVFSLLSLTACSGLGYGAHDLEGEGPLYHEVQRGETLMGISKQYGVSYKSLALLNGIRDPSQLAAGQLLLISFRGEGETREPTFIAHAPRTGTTEVHKARAFIASKNGRLGWPAAGGEIASEFGPRGDSFHDGLDIAARTGTPIYAAHDGVVAYSDNGLSGYGNLVILQSRSGMITVYAHCSKNLVDVGEEVRRGERIALVGETGHATGPHLHFEVRVQDKRGRYLAVDPLPLFQEKSDKGLRYRINESLTPILARLNPWR